MHNKTVQLKPKRPKRTQSYMRVKRQVNNTGCTGRTGGRSSQSALTDCPSRKSPTHSLFLSLSPVGQDRGVWRGETGSPAAPAPSLWTGASARYTCGQGTLCRDTSRPGRGYRGSPVQRLHTATLKMSRAF